MLGHLVSNGHTASPGSEPRIVSTRAIISQDRSVRHLGWFSRLIAQLLHRH